jgi:hypothetical protein
MANTDTTDWRFVEAREVPPGPWRRYGENNPFVQSVQSSSYVKAEAPAKKQGSAAEATPNVVVR